MPISVLLTESYHPLLANTLSQQSEIYLTHLERPSPEEVRAALSHAEIWVMRGAIPLDKTLLQVAPHLRAVIRAGSGVEHIDQEALRQRHIQLFSTPHANAAPVAEYVVGTLITLTHRLLPAHHALRERNEWHRHSFIGREVSSLTVGIIGFGQNGSRTARLLHLLGASVLAYDKYKSGFTEHGIVEAPLERLWDEADVLSLHLPLTEETRGWIDAPFLQRFRKPIALINAARGGILSLVALAQGLRTGQIWGAALDTLPSEPPARLTGDDRAAWEYLRAHPAVLLTPHIAGLTEESELRLAQSILLTLRTLLHGHTYP